MKLSVFPIPLEIILKNYSFRLMKDKKGTGEKRPYLKNRISKGKSNVCVNFLYD